MKDLCKYIFAYVVQFHFGASKARETKFFKQHISEVVYLIALRKMMIRKQPKGWRTPNSSYSLMFILVLSQFIITEQFYLPGLAPVNYCVTSDASTNCKVSTIKIL